MNPLFLDRYAGPLPPIQVVPKYMGEIDQKYLHESAQEQHARLSAFGGLSVSSIAQADLAKVEEALQVGRVAFWETKARNLKEIARILTEEHGG